MPEDEHAQEGSDETPTSGGTQLYKVAAYSTGEFVGFARLDWEDESGPRSRPLGKSTILGSSENADVVFRDATVSRLHAELEICDDGVWIRDLGSRNGTFVQGVRVERALVPHLGRIRVGKTDLVLTHSRAGAREATDWPSASFHALRGGSRKMRALYATLTQIATADAPALILGETGTGKEVVARAIHEASPRNGAPFVIVDCAALPENLLDAELFGHAKGAFTGAAASRDGAIESAHTGTVFLDEIGELPKSMQPKLLRVLEAKTVRRIGENEHRPVDVRFVFATHRDLLKMVSTGDFREDLYFRIGVLPVHLPPLRERLDDLEMLIQHFSGDDRAVSTDLLDALRARPWNGNVRELRNFVDRMKALGPERALAMTNVHAAPSPPTAPVGRASVTFEVTPSMPSEGAKDAGAPSAPSTQGPFRSFRDRWNEQGERMYVHDLLARHEHNVSAAAREAELDRTYLHKLIRKYGL
jgi:transcriptional regulator with GAF, ATPase, and Fis domain